jgi:selT/selW/selH-like putative selenoprotein
MIRSGGGVFEVVVDGELVFSKKKLDRFPEHSEVFESIDAM